MIRGSSLKALLLLGALVLLGACGQAVFKSKFELDQQGISYFLPKTLVKVKITPAGVAADTPVAELTTEEREAAGSGGVETAIRINGRYHTVLVKADGKLAKDLITSLTLEIDDENSRQVADVTYNYVLQYQPSILATDQICVGVTNRSLLKTVEAAVKDETGNIAISIAKFVGRLVGPDPFATTVEPTSLADRAITVEIDPLDSLDLKSVGRAIDRHFPGLKGQYRLTTDAVKKFARIPKPEACPENHICYRTLVPIRLELKSSRTKQFSVAYAKVANQGVVNTIDVTRAFLVEKITRLEFNNGVLNKAIIKKPSEGLEVAKLPLTVYDALLTSALAAPGNFLGEVTSAKSQAQFNAALTQSATTAMELNEIQEDLEDLRTDTTATERRTRDSAAATSPFKVVCPAPNAAQAGTKQGGST